MLAQGVPAADLFSSVLPRLCELPDELSRPSPLLHGFLGPIAVAIVAITGPLRRPWAQPAVQPAPGSRMAGDWQGVPARVLAPQRGAARILASRASVPWFMGLILDFAGPLPL